nr:2'-5' RNA ligase family protein [Bacteroidota bacterium]
METMTYDKTYKTAIVLIPPEHTWHSIQQIRKLHDKQFNRWMPHITLSYPFLPYAHLEAVCNTLKNKLQNFSPFEVNLNTFQYFRHHTNTFTIWLKPDHERRIFDLHEAIWKL